ncbi:unnamed protein product [Ranitomeya imitator]|uniref:Alcohol dehydrogenase n=1 Tax=Ranitomeya imitator TaxID=111125 RepID=A0ABN9KUD5_9NEOB|nr:unnamed protein product [Ranitomeya imitator]
MQRPRYQHQDTRVSVLSWCGRCSVSPYTLSKVLGEVSLCSKAVQTVDAAPGGQVVAVAGVGGNLHIAELC